MQINDLIIFYKRAISRLGRRRVASQLSKLIFFTCFSFRLRSDHPTQRRVERNYCFTTMTQERLNGLVTIALENDILEKINYEDMIKDFISKNTRRMLLFSRT